VEFLTLLTSIRQFVEEFFVFVVLVRLNNVKLRLFPNNSSFHIDENEGQDAKAQRYEYEASHPFLCFLNFLV
jgi:hypothetical protein